MPDTQTVLMVIGFILASYAIIGNDAIQTIGTFLSSNRSRPWWQLWIFTASILVVVLYYGWLTSPSHDASYGRLTDIGFPPGGLNWIYIVPPIAILILTRFGIPEYLLFVIDYLRAWQFAEYGVEVIDGVFCCFCCCYYFVLDGH